MASRLCTTWSLGGRAATMAVDPFPAAHLHADVLLLTPSILTLLRYPFGVWCFDKNSFRVI